MERKETIKHYKYKKLRVLILVLAIVLTVTVVSLEYLHIHNLNPNQLHQATANQSLSEEIPKFDHIVIILMENHSYNRILKNKLTPYINSLADKYGLSENYTAVARPSQPNYLALIGGSTFGISSNCSNCYVQGNNLTDQLDLQHKSWKAYMESMPASCFIGNAPPYVERHNPFIFFNDIRRGKSCKKIVPYSELKIDLQKENTTPNFIWISPNLCNDMHDCSEKIADTWLSKQIPSMLNSHPFKRGKSLIILTWDEGNKFESNHVATIFISSDVKQHYVSKNPYNHYSLLHTIENLWNIPPITAEVKNSKTMMEFFKQQ